MSKLVGNSEITGALYVNGIGGYNGGNPAYGVNDVATIFNNPVVIYETDGTNGLLGLNASPMDETTWQLENLDLTPFKFVRCYFKQSDLAIANNNYFAAGCFVDIILEDAAKSKGSGVCTMYAGGVTTLLPNNRNRFYNIVACVDSTKTKFKVAFQTYLWDITTSDANTDGKYLYKIEGYR